MWKPSRLVVLATAAGSLVLSACARPSDDIKVAPPYASQVVTAGECGPGVPIHESADIAQPLPAAQPVKNPKLNAWVAKSDVRTLADGTQVYAIAYMGKDAIEAAMTEGDLGYFWGDPDTGRAPEWRKPAGDGNFVAMLYATREGRNAPRFSGESAAAPGLHSDRTLNGQRIWSDGLCRTITDGKTSKALLTSYFDKVSCEIAGLQTLAAYLEDSAGQYTATALGTFSFSCPDPNMSGGPRFAPQIPLPSEQNGRSQDTRQRL